jgi:hypothetical protein
LHTPIVKITIHSVYNEKNEQVSPFVVFDLWLSFLPGQDKVFA